MDAGDDGQGKEKPHAFYFSIIAIFTGIPSGSHCGGERFYQMLYFRVNLFSLIRAADWLEQTS